MSVIGPRPALWNQDVLIAEREKYHANDVKPGLTGWAQINGRDELEIPVKAKLDGEYVEKESLLFDIKCFLRQLESRQYDSKKGSSLASIVGSTFLYALLHLPYLDNISIVLYNFMALGTCTMCALGIIGLTYSFRVLQNKGMIIVYNSLFFSSEYFKIL